MPRLRFLVTLFPQYFFSLAVLYNIFLATAALYGIVTAQIKFSFSKFIWYTFRPVSLEFYASAFETKLFKILWDFLKFDRKEICNLT